MFNGGNSYQDVIKIAGHYTDDVKNASMIINSYLRKGEFIVFDLIRPEDDPLAICLRFNTPLNLQKEIKARQKCKKKLNKQALHQIHKLQPKFIQYASFSSIQTLNKAHQSDITPMSHDKVGNHIYKYREVIKIIATRYRCSFALTDKSSAQMAKAIQKIYNDLNDPLNLPKDFIVDRGTKYMGECRDLLLSYGVRIQYTNSKHGIAIAKSDHQEFEKHAYFWQDAEDFHLSLTDRSRTWFKGLCINDNIFNNTPTLLIGMSPNETVKKALKGKVEHRRPVCYNKPLLPSYTEVWHLLEPGELEGGRKRATDCNWSPEVFTIDSYLIKENQPILYKLYNDLRCSFAFEALWKALDLDYMSEKRACRLDHWIWRYLRLKLRYEFLTYIVVKSAHMGSLLKFIVYKKFGKLLLDHLVQDHGKGSYNHLDYLPQLAQHLDLILSNIFAIFFSMS
ncbi:hypothetical protein RCL_jg17326.t1 [Rhizophagus clarus]|uniref:Integrase catalytic domain-containing protein n=1 Tax=Rhizophagus clarus TaxID=94130 RepID=A0A8H3QEV5_9GLOM|nr:hypothetical protein RCL_jg17326.t1 [Rhizophagus clarus]